MRTAVIGATGYAAGELLRLLAGHPHLEVAAVGGSSSRGEVLERLLPNLAGVPGLPERVVGADDDQVASCELVLLATPHAVSADLGAALAGEGRSVIDLSGAFRLPAATLSDWYGLDHPAPDLTPAAYGLPELFAEEVAAAVGGVVAGPGCYPTAALLALACLVGDDGALVEPDGVTVVGMSGLSGAGRAARDDLHGPHAIGNVAAYGAPRHRHTPEIEQGWARLSGADAHVTFTPHLVPASRGLVATVTAPLRPDADPGSVRAAAERLAAGSRFVHLLDDGQWPATTHVVGGNAAHLGVAVDRRAGTAVVSCAIDNLVKGASGQAVQCANLLAGLPEHAGLSPAGVHP